MNVQSPSVGLESEPGARRRDEPVSGSTVSQELDIVVSVEERARIERLLRDYRFATDTESRCAELLRARIVCARCVPSAQLPRAVVTMYSTVKVVDLDRREALTHTIVYPGHSSEYQSYVSVLSPIGVALFGLRDGATVECSDGAKRMRLAIKEILYQPEWDLRNRFAHTAFAERR